MSKSTTFKYITRPFRRGFHVYDGPSGVGVYIGSVRRADPSGPPHARHGGWDAATPGDKAHAFAFVSRRAASLWLLSFAPRKGGAS